MDTVKRLAGGVAHRLNNELTVMLGLSQLLLDRADPADQARRDLEEICRAGRRAAALIEDLMAFGGVLPLRPEEVSLNELIATAVSALDGRLGPHVEVVAVSSPGTPLVRVDSRQLQRVIADLAGFTAAGTWRRSRITIQVAEAGPDGGGSGHDGAGCLDTHAKVVVHGSHNGVAPESLARLFEPFYTTMTLGLGTGLGLAAAHGIVAQSGGCLHAEHDESDKIRFTISLPRHR